jgi:outer membrane protein
MPSKTSVIPVLIGCFLAGKAMAQFDLPSQIDGDLGGSVYLSQGIVHGQRVSQMVLPYAYFDAGRFFARVDTFGVRILPLAYGYLEFVGRASFEGYRTSDTRLHGIHDRSNPVPLGISSYQETPMGAFFLYAFHDQTSSGSLLEISYATALNVGNWTVYPQIANSSPIPPSVPVETRHLF